MLQAVPPEKMPKEKVDGGLKINYLREYCYVKIWDICYNFLANWFKLVRYSALKGWLYMEVIIMMIIGGIILFQIIAGAVKMGVREALYEFKEEINKEFNLKK